MPSTAHEKLENGPLEAARASNSAVACMLHVRATHGHSIPVELDLAPQSPPDILYHGTVHSALEGIRREGLKSQRRQYVHLSETVEAARSVGGRRGEPVILTIQAAEMAAAGHDFFHSQEGVSLTEHVPAEYVEEPQN